MLAWLLIPSVERQQFFENGPFLLLLENKPCLEYSVCHVHLPMAASRIARMAGFVLQEQLLLPLLLPLGPSKRRCLPLKSLACTCIVPLHVHVLLFYKTEQASTLTWQATLGVSTCGSNFFFGISVCLLQTFKSDLCIVALCRLENPPNVLITFMTKTL